MTRLSDRGPLPPDTRDISYSSNKWGVGGVGEVLSLY